MVGSGRGWWWGAKRHPPARMSLGTLIHSETIVRSEQILKDEPSNDPNGISSEEGVPFAHPSRLRNVGLCATYP